MRLIRRFGKTRNIQDSLVLVTGAAGDIGSACCMGFVGTGAKVIGCDNRIEESNFELDRKRGYELIKLDVTDPADWAKVVHKYGEIDILINGAGIMPAKTFIETSYELRDRQVNVNLKGVMNGTAAVLPGMLRQEYGRIINIASVLGTIPMAGAATYAATKAGVIAFTDSINIEIRGTGVSCCYVLPSTVSTNMTVGLKMPLWPPLITSEMVAKAIVRAAQHKKAEVWVPGILKWVIEPGKLFPRSIREYFAGEIFGLYRMFTNADQQKRKEYEDRVLNG